jgi:hypothetical protein
MELVKQIMNHLPVKATDIVEISPPLDCANITSWAALKVIFEIFGRVFSRKKGSAGWAHSSDLTRTEQPGGETCDSCEY